MDIDNLSKMQMVMLVLLVSFVTSFVTGIVTVALIDQAPPRVTQTIQKVVERVKEFPAPVKNTDSDKPEGQVSGVVTVITQEEQIINIVENNSRAMVSIVATGTTPEITGIGFFISSDGLVITGNQAVADESKSYGVVLGNGDFVPVSALARNTALDLAILKADGEGLGYIAPGDSDQLKVGQTIVALGRGSEDGGVSVSVGVISGFGSVTIVKPNSEPELKEPQKTIQTSIAINAENSGGPLLDMAGNVIGVNTVIANGSEHVRFALPINFAKKIIAELNSAD